jgi:hypothetical protein
MCILSVIETCQKYSNQVSTLVWAWLGCGDVCRGVALNAEPTVIRCTFIWIPAEALHCRICLVHHHVVEHRLRLQILLLRRAGWNVPRGILSQCNEEEQESKAEMQNFVPMRSTLTTRCMCLGISTVVSSLMRHISVYTLYIRSTKYVIKQVFLPWWRQLATGFSLRNLTFIFLWLCMRSVINKVTMDQVFLQLSSLVSHK